VLQSIAKEMNLPQQAAQVGAEMSARALSKMIADAQAESEAWKAEQKAEWEKTPNHAELTLKAKRALKHAGLLDHAKDNGYLHDAKLMQAFAAFGKLVSEGEVVVAGKEGAAQKQHPYGNEWK
jgi:hypothetical protein